MKLALRLFINVITVIAIMLLLEVACRITLHYVYNRSFDSSLIIDNKYFTSSGLKENAEGTVWGKKFHTDALGCRKNKAPLDAKKKKWLFIGDSVTEGVGVEDNETFSSLCSEELKDYSVLNCSLIGYSTNDYLNVLTHYLNTDSTVELVTVFFCLNDVYGSAKSDSLPVMAQSGATTAARNFLQEHYATYKLLKLFMFRNANRYFQYDAAYYTADNARFKESMNYLYLCDSLCKARGIYFNVVMMPYRSQLTEDKGNRTPQQMVAEYCSSNGIEFFDAVDNLAKEKQPEALFLFADEIHFSAEGHKAIARFLLQ
ncbi:MAG: SGNH/GDSL hydrolase family protein [Chitinophagales bacterium]